MFPEPGTCPIPGLRSSQAFGRQKRRLPFVKIGVSNELMKTQESASLCKGRMILAACCALLPAVAPVYGGRPANRVVATIPVGKIPLDAVVSPDSSTIYVSNVIPSAVSVIDAATNTITFVISTDISPSGLAISPDGRTLYVSCMETMGISNVIDVISTATKTITARISFASNQAGPSLIALTPDGSQLYCPFYHSISIVNTATNTVSGTINNPINNYFPQQIVFTASGANAYVAALLSGHTVLSVVDTATQSLVSTRNFSGETDCAIASYPPANQIYVGSRVNGVKKLKISVVDSTTNTVVPPPVFCQSVARASASGLPLMAIISTLSTHM